MNKACFFFVTQRLIREEWEALQLREREEEQKREFAKQAKEVTVSNNPLTKQYPFTEFCYFNFWFKTKYHFKSSLHADCLKQPPN